MTNIKDKLKMKGVLEIYTREVGAREWIKTKEVENLVTQSGYQIIANRITGEGTYAAKTLGYFTVSDGTETPALTNTAASFLADGTTYTKAVESVDTFSTVSLLQIWNCYLSSVENTVTSITKFMISDAAVPTVGFNDLLFDAVPKSTQIEIYFRYKLYMSQS